MHLEIEKLWKEYIIQFKFIVLNLIIKDLQYFNNKISVIEE